MNCVLYTVLIKKFNLEASYMQTTQARRLSPYYLSSIFYNLVVITLVTSCGGTSSSKVTATNVVEKSSSSASSIPSPTQAPNTHGIFPDAKGIYQTDEDAGIFPNEHGFARSFSTKGTIDKTNAFFTAFGNGRSCDSCHKQAEGFSITPRGLQERFATSNGTDPIFALVDGANSPLTPVNTLVEKKAAYSLLLNRGVFRIAMKMPEAAEFEIIKIDDPYHFATPNELSLYRRPLPSANLIFVTDVMWDSRETQFESNSINCLPLTNNCFASLDSNLGRQANNATKGHAEAGAGLSDSDIKAIVDFEKTLFVAQQVDNNAGLLFSANGTGGALAISKFNFVFGGNDFFGLERTIFVQSVFQLFSSWFTTETDQTTLDARAAIERGQSVFNSKEFFIKKLPGISDVFGDTSFFTNCSTCHSTPNVGNLSRPQHSFDLGLTTAELRSPDMPLYTLKNKSTDEIIETTDPGKAMITGRWLDMNRFKTPSLRGLAARPPYFHDGSAQTIEDVTAFYNKRFGSILTPQEISDLNVFLKSL